jgi:hypothetical protein
VGATGVVNRLPPGVPRRFERLNRKELVLGLPDHAVARAIGVNDRLDVEGRRATATGGEDAE